MNKKLIVLAAFLLALATLVKPASASQYPYAGSLIKSAGSSQVYLVDSIGVAHPFESEAVYWSWYNGTWKSQNIKTISAYNFQTITVGESITMRPGSALIRFSNSLVMYAVLPNHKLCYASSHYGNYQYKRAAVIPSAYEADYYKDMACNISDYSNLPDGSLFQYSGSDDIWYVQNGYKRHVYAAGMTANKFRWESVIKDIGTWMSYPEGAAIYGYDDSISNPLNYLANGYQTPYRPVCTENWSCSSYSGCAYGSQTRACYDLNGCGTTYNKPVTSQSCYKACTENWICNSWNSCLFGAQSRTCYDSNYCGTTYNRPVLSQSCAQSCTETWNCSSWSSCSGGRQYRVCNDSNRCGSQYLKPVESQTCYN